MYIYIQCNLVIKRSDITKPSYNKVILLVPALYISLFFIMVPRTLLYRGSTVYVCVCVCVCVCVYVFNQIELQFDYQWRSQDLILGGAVKNNYLRGSGASEGGGGVSPPSQ